MPFKSDKQRKWMHANEPDMAKKWEKEEAIREKIRDIIKQEIKSVKEERDYKEEYKKYGSSTKSKKYRAELNQYNRKKGTYGNGDGKDASHKGGKIVGFEKESTNRGRAEKSRLKKESVTEIDRRAKSQIFSEWNKFEKAYSNFFKTAVKLGKVTTKVTGDKTDEKIIIKNFTTDVGKFYSLMQSWVRGQNESVNEELQNSQGEQTDFKKGDLVKDINPDCPHVGSEGGVIKVGKGTITFKVTNNGKTYHAGDELEKTVDQMVKLSQSPFEDDHEETEKQPMSEAIKVRVGETAKTGKWEVYNPETNVSIKEVGNTRAATRLMNRLMSSGQYDNVASRWVGEIVKEKISKEEWSEYPKYARKLKPYMRRLLKIPVKVRVIKQANHNPWIDVRVARSGKDIIPNDFRKRALKVIGGGRARDMDNINYGNIRTGSVSLKYDEWVKLLGNKVK